MINILLSIIIVILIAIWFKLEKKEVKKAVAKVDKLEPKYTKESESLSSKSEEKKPIKRQRIRLSDEELRNKRDRYDELLDIKEKELLSDDAVFFRMKVNKLVFKKYASDEQKIRLKELQEKCKQEHRNRFAQMKIGRR